MDDFTRTLKRARTRTKQGAIVDLSGRIGRWPFRRTISYHVGVNCDAISLRDGQLIVQRRGRTIAIAEPLGSPSRFARMLHAALVALLHPRHARQAAADLSHWVKWQEQFRAPPRK